jgi:hypothetical protein
MERAQRFPTLGEVTKPPEQVRGETMTTLVDAIARERAANGQKTRRVRGGIRADARRTCLDRPRRIYTDHMADRGMKGSKVRARDVEERREPDLDESPFELGAVAGLPFDKDSEEARAIRAVIEKGDRERAARSGRREPDLDESPFEVGAVAGLPFDKDSEEARAIRAVIEKGDRERAARSGR